MALLASGNKLVEELGFEDLLSAETKKDYVEEQIKQVSMMLWRERVDLSISENVETTSEDQKEALETKAKEQRNNVKNYVRALKVLKALQEEL